MACSGDASKTCGGSWALNVYTTGTVTLPTEPTWTRQRGLLRRRGDAHAAGLNADAYGAHHGELPDHLRGAGRDDRGDGERQPVLLRHDSVQGRWCWRRRDRVHNRVCWYVLWDIVLFAHVLMYVRFIGNSAEMCGGGWRINVYVQAGVTI